MRTKRGKHSGYSARNIKHDERVEYIRFVVPHIDEDSQRELGVFHAAASLHHKGRLKSHEVEEYVCVREWFNENLERPARFTASKPPYHRKRSKAISWFKDSAHEHIARVRSLVAILERHGMPVKMLRAKRVGYVVYEDEYQIVAEAFAGEKY